MRFVITNIQKDSRTEGYMYKGWEAHISTTSKLWYADVYYKDGNRWAENIKADTFDLLYEKILQFLADITKNVPQDVLDTKCEWSIVREVPAEGCKRKFEMVRKGCGRAHFSMSEEFQAEGLSTYYLDYKQSQKDHVKKVLDDFNGTSDAMDAAVYAHDVMQNISKPTQVNIEPREESFGQNAVRKMVSKVGEAFSIPIHGSNIKKDTRNGINTEVDE